MACITAHYRTRARHCATAWALITTSLHLTGGRTIVVQPARVARTSTWSGEPGPREDCGLCKHDASTFW